MGFLTFALTRGTNYWTSLFPGVLFIGLGMGITVAPLTATMMESVASHRVGLASGINNAVSRIAGLLAIAILGVILAATFNARLSARLDAAHANPARRAQVDAQRVNLAGAHLADQQLRDAVLASYAEGFRTVGFMCALLAAAGGLTSLLLIEKKPTPIDV
ncbi:MAG: hypothetical protein GIW98_05645 [Candidatus Eremiobacteraeota bacterium]|nr:hypothetical protein [Candidatus Eremiobacteraeota bacterium]